MNLLALITKASIRLNLPVPVSVVASMDPQVQLIRECAAEEGKSLAGRHTWQALLMEKSFTTVATPAQTSSVPADFSRMVPESMFNRDTNRRLDGPIDSDTWQSIQASLVTFVIPAFRIWKNTIYITPTPAAGQTVAYEYVSIYWCQSFGGDNQEDWVADSDIYKLNDETMILGIIWRFKKSKGLQWSDDYLVYERYVGDLIMRDGSRPRIYTDQPNWDRRPTPPQIPQTLDIF